jgi:3-oxoacyl-[acyl-carrier protein] reductase
MRLKDKVALITGAGSGIGQATAEKFAREGARLALADLNFEKVARVAEEIAAAGTDTMALRADVSRLNDMNVAVKHVLEAYGRVDVLVNNAGITRDATLRNMTEERFDEVIAVNLKGVYNSAHAVLPAMLAQGGGVILNASSVVGLYGNFGQTNYAATKSGVIGMTKTWARELARKGIRANAVCPGFIGTDMVRAMPEKILAEITSRVPGGRLGTPEEVANVYAFLASDEAAYVNGAVIEVSGGITL